MRLLFDSLNILACVSCVLNTLSVPGAKQGESRVSFGQVFGHKRGVGSLYVQIESRMQKVIRPQILYTSGVLV